MTTFVRLAIFLLACTILAGCTRPPIPPKTAKIDVQAKAADAWPRAVETFRYPDNPRVGDDWTRFRTGLQLLDDYFAKPEVIERLRLSSKQRSFLAEECHLTEAELAEVDSIGFRPADPHYLDECYLVRDASRSIEVDSLSPLEQAQVHFRWVMRNVLLHDQVDTWTPPAETLRRGYGNAIERTLVFLAMLRQIQVEERDGEGVLRKPLEGCVIASPDKAAGNFLVGVLEPKTQKLHLFDPRLGVILRGNDGKALLTLQDAIDKPSLLAASNIPQEQVKNLETWLVCPLYSLAPRFMELERNLATADRITLAMNAPELHALFSKASGKQAKVWNPPATANETPNSATRCLRLFLPKQEGGVDESGRAIQVLAARIPFATVITNLATVNVDKKIMPKPFQELIGLTDEIFNKYDLQTRELYLRGQFRSMGRRHERMRLFARDEALSGLARDKTFLADLDKWRTDLRTAHENLTLDSDDPRRKAEAQYAINKLWGQDHFVAWLRDVEKDEHIDREGLREQLKKAVPSRILAIGFRDYFDLELARAQAMVSHEEADRSQSILDKTAKPSTDLQNQTRDKWTVAARAWSTHYLDRIALEYTIEQRAKAIQTQRPEEFDLRLGLLETAHLDVAKYVGAKLSLADCLERTEGPAAAVNLLASTSKQLSDIEKKGLLKAEVQSLADAFRKIADERRLPPPIRTAIQNRIDLLGKDWNEQGNYYWIKKQIAERIRG